MDKGWLTNEHPLLWDAKFNKKPAYYGVQKALLDSR
jgi:GH35 family endo-1,4-beta-xylanase